MSTTEALRAAIREALEGELSVSAYDCTRVWEAWNVGTMSREDFTPTVERLDDIVGSVCAALAAAAPSQKPFGHFIHIAAEQRGEFVHDLDEAIEDLTNCECEVTALYDHPATPSPATAPTVPNRVVDFVRTIAGQKPEKPDYWSECGQCSINIRSAEDLLEDISAMIESAAAPSPADPWQTIETAPTAGIKVLLWWEGATRYGWCQGVGTARDGGDVWRVPSLETVPVGSRPTHWMPLPAAPGAQPAPSEIDPRGSCRHCTVGKDGECVHCYAKQGQACQYGGEVPAEPSVAVPPPHVKSVLVARCETALDSIEAMLGGRNGPSIQLRAWVRELSTVDGGPPTGSTENRIDRLETELAQARAAVPEGQNAEEIAKRFNPVAVASWFLHHKHWRGHYEQEVKNCESRIHHQRAEIVRLQNAVTAASIMTGSAQSDSLTDEQFGHLSLAIDTFEEQADDFDQRGNNSTAEGLRARAYQLRQIAAILSTAISADARDGAPTAAARDVLAERARQISAEGWTPEHDNEHRDNELSRAAACYAIGSVSVSGIDGMSVWPWHGIWWKPADERGNLIKAGALILAEIERLDRAAIAAAQAPRGSM